MATFADIANFFQEMPNCGPCLMEKMSTYRLGSEAFDPKAFMNSMVVSYVFCNYSLKCPRPPEQVMQFLEVVTPYVMHFYQSARA